MTKKSISLTFFVLFAGLVLALVYSARDRIEPRLKRALSSESRQFVAIPPPAPELLQLYDMGIVDANGDGRLDIYTSAHNYRQILWLADGKGSYEDALSEWGLDQNHAFPGGEQSHDVPPIDKPGLYIYWQGDVLNLVAHQVDGLGAWKGVLQLYNKAEVMRSDGFSVENALGRASHDAVPVSQVTFAAQGNGHLALYVSTRGTPLAFNIDAPWARSRIYVGTQRIVPPANDFELTLRDRHGFAWSDYNNDGHLDAFITRGALGGTLRKFPPKVRDQVSDELLVSQGPGRFVEQSRNLGIGKKDCSGRHVRWVDYNHDGLLDLYINCQDRGNVAGGYPKQFYQQDASGHFTDIASLVGLAIPDFQLIDFAWLDADGDGTIDMLTHEDTGFFLYSRQDGKFTRTLVHRGGFVRSSVKGLKGNTDDYWQFDGKLNLADYDNDGDLDVFVASKKGNTLLVNHNGQFKTVDPASAGLPKASVAAAWVDYDNDGRPDLHTLPEGVFHQGTDHRFTATGYLALENNKYQAAFIHWFDMDNDGKLDVLMATQENAALWRWWEKPFRSKDVKGEDDRFRWKLMAYRNIGGQNHWLQLKLRGAAGNRQAIGAHATLVTPAGRQSQVVGSNDSSYFSQGHYRLYFGLGEQTRGNRLEIRWPDGHAQTIDNVKPDQLLEVVRDGQP